MASGYSRRFGEDNKLMMPYKQHTVIQQVVETAVAAGIFERVVLVTSYDNIKALYMEEARVTSVANPNSDKGISESIKLGTAALGDMDGYMYIPGDQVLLSEKTLKSLVETFKANPEKILVPTYDGQRGSPKIFPASMKSGLLNLVGDDGGKSLINGAVVGSIHHVIEGAEEQKDIDTYEDYEMIRKEQS